MLGRIVFFSMALVAPILSACSVSGIECPAPEWIEASAEALPPLRPRNSVDLGTEVREGSPCQYVETAFEIPGETASGARGLVRERALAAGWQIDPASRCISKFLASIPTGLGVYKDDPKDDPGVFVVEALPIAEPYHFNEPGRQPACTKEGFVK